MVGVGVGQGEVTDPCISETDSGKDTWNEKRGREPMGGQRGLRGGG